MFRKSQLNFIKSFILILVLFIGMVYAFQDGDGSSGNPYQISTCEELQNMSSCLSCNYTLVSDVVCGIPPYNVGAGFMPVGNNSISFTGNLNGDGYEVQDLYINRSGDDYVGLFGSTDLANIINVRLVNIQIKGRNDVGAIAGKNGENIMNVYASGNIEGNWSVGGISGTNWFGIINSSSFNGNIVGIDSIGGLVGYHRNGLIDNSYSIGNVNGTDSVGGLVGYGNGNIENSYSTSDVDGIWGVGGLVGYNDDIIENSYSTGNVNGVTATGGLVGYNDGDINNSFTISQVNGTNSNYGGLIGDQRIGGSLSNVWWNNISSNINHSFGSGSTTGAFTNNTLSYFYDCSNPPMSSWNTTNDWSCTGTDLPQFAWQTIPSVPSFSEGSSIFPFGNVFSILTFLIVFFIFN